MHRLFGGERTDVKTPCSGKRKRGVAVDTKVKEAYDNCNPKSKEKFPMKIAVTYENGEVFQHFGHCPQFKIFEVKGDSIVNEEIVDAGGSGHGALAAFLSELDVNAVICGGIGGGAQAALAQEGILVFGGVQGKVDDVMQDLMRDELDYNPAVHCDHHDAHHGEDHVCGSGCGSCGGCH